MTSPPCQPSQRDQLQPFRERHLIGLQWPVLDVSDAASSSISSMVSLGNPVGENLSDLDAPHSAHAMSRRTV